MADTTTTTATKIVNITEAAAAEVKRLLAEEADKTGGGR